MTVSGIRTSGINFPERSFGYSSSFGDNTFIDSVAEETIDICNQLGEFFTSFLMKIETDSSSTKEIVLYYPTETSSYSLDFLNKITFDDISKISNFLVHHTDIIYDVLIGCQVATEIFEKNTKFILSVENDEEMDLHYLVLAVQLKKFEPIILEKIDTIFDSYSYDIREKSSHFIVTAKFE